MSKPKKQPIFKLEPRSQSQAELIHSIDTKDISVGIGPAGTGKTFIATMKAVDALENYEVNKLILTRPAITAEEDIGFLPGDLQEKMNPYLRPIIDALEYRYQPEKVAQLIHEDRIEMTSVGFLRGRSFYNAFIIVDEAQNMTYDQWKMVLTRFGEGCKMVITGDPSQSDLPAGKSGMPDWVTILESVKEAMITEFTRKDVVRHNVVKSILKAEGG